MSKYQGFFLHQMLFCLYSTFFEVIQSLVTMYIMVLLCASHRGIYVLALKITREGRLKQYEKLLY